MRHRDVRGMLLALVLSVPWLIAAVGPARPGVRLGPTLLAEVVLVAGLLRADQLRRALLRARRAADARPPSAARARAA
jgi:hypothetical protein